MKHKSNHASTCPIARSLDVIGEWWSLLIVRDAMLGVRRFSDFQRRLGMAKNILSARLKRLVEADVLQVVPASDGSAYQEYELTDKGKALLPTLVALRQWGEQFMFHTGERRTALIDRKKHRPLEKLQVRDADGNICGVGDVSLIDSPISKAAARKTSPSGRRPPSSQAG